MKYKIHLDLFSGYGGFHLAFSQAGAKFKKVYFSEINKYAIANYRYNFPNAEYLGAVEHVSKWKIEKPDIITFGWPCQDNSIAGKRAGQKDGTRSGLLNFAVAAINRFKPRVFVAENVEGLRTVNKGTDIIESLKVLAGLHEDCPQYEVEMQLLNTRWFIPQNRERLFFVGHLRGQCAGKVFPITETKELDNARKNKEKICRPASTLTARQYANWNGNYIIHNLQQRMGKGNGGKGHLKKQDNSTYALDTKNMQAIELVDEEIRRLMPIECERLQGLPDQWTKYGIFNGEKKEISDSQRYKMIGNGVSIPPVKLIAEKILELWQ